MPKRHEKRAMPGKYIDFWHAVVAAFELYWPNIFMASIAFMIALLRGIYTGNKIKRSLLEAGVIFFFAIGTGPAATPAGIPVEYATAFMAVVAFLGIDLSRDHLVSGIDKLFNKWLGK